MSIYNDENVARLKQNRNRNFASDANEKTKIETGKLAL